jgi:hypothetical protein
MQRRLVPLAFFLLPACSGKDATSLLADASASTDAAADAQPKADANLTPAPDASADAAACTLTAPYSTKNQLCNTCAEAHCCAAINACYASKDCDEGYVNCVIACALTEKDKPAYDACAAVCSKDYPTGAKLFNTINACADKSCATECAN